MRVEISICVWYKWRDIDMHLICVLVYRYIFDIWTEISIYFWCTGRYIDMHLIYGSTYRYSFDIRTDISICIWYTGRHIDIVLIYVPKYRYVFDIRADVSICVWYNGRYQSVWVENRAVRNRQNSNTKFKQSSDMTACCGSTRFEFSEFELIDYMINPSNISNISRYFQDRHYSECLPNPCKSND